VPSTRRRPMRGDRRVQRRRPSVAQIALAWLPGHSRKVTSVIIGRPRRPSKLARQHRRHRRSRSARRAGSSSTGGGVSRLRPEYRAGCSPRQGEVAAQATREADAGSGPTMRLGADSLCGRLDRRRQRDRRRNNRAPKERANDFSPINKSSRSPAFFCRPSRPPRLWATAAEPSPRPFPNKPLAHRRHLHQASAPPYTPGPP